MNKPGAGTFSRDFWKLWSAPAVSNVGDGIRLTALPHLIAAITRDPVVVSGVTAATFAPWLLLSLPGGAIVDRVNRRALIIVFQSVRACVGGNHRSGGDDGCGVTSLLPQLMFPWASAPHDANTDLQRIEGEAFALRAALELLGKAARVDSSRVAIVGHDFGAMHGALLSAGSDPACVAVIAPTPRWSDRFLRFWPIDGDRFDYMRTLDPVDPITAIGNVSTPTLFQFGQKDFYIAAMTGSELFGAAREPKTMKTYDSDHAVEVPQARVDHLDFLVEHLELEQPEN